MLFPVRFLRPGSLAAILAAACVVAVAGSQNPTDPQAVPKSDANDSIVRGCVQGSRLIERVSDYTDMTAAAGSNDPQAYELRGPKSLLKELAKAHQGRLVEVVGIVRVRGVDQAPPQGGRKIGDKTSVIVRSGKTRDSNAGALPGNTLEIVVKSFEVLGEACRDR